MNDREPVVQVKRLSKKFCQSLKRSLWYGVKDLASELAGRKRGKNLRDKEFWAIRDISFELRRGETLGIIGPNGAGKTTLLRMLNGLIKPDNGSITIRGQVCALIALGAGFNPILTGRENIYINAAVLGLSKLETDLILNDIIDFAEIHEFVDMPVQNYSSGMRVRLGFAIAAFLKPDLLLVDEVLAVGDYAFREKSSKQMQRMCNSGAAVIFISHNMAAIQTICHRVLWVEKGRIHRIGPAEQVVKEYLKEQMAIVEKNAREELNKPNPASHGEASHNRLQIHKIELFDQKGSVARQFQRGDTLGVRIHYIALEPIESPNFVVHVKSAREVLFVADMLRDNNAPPVIEGQGIMECIFEKLPLLPNRYIVSVFVLGRTPIIKIVFPPKEVFFSVDTQNTEKDESVMSLIRSPGVLPVVNKWRLIPEGP